MCILSASDPTSGFILWSSCVVCNRKIIMKNKGSNNQFQMQWNCRLPVTASVLTLTKCVTGFLSEPSKVKRKIVLTQEIMGDGTWPRWCSAPRNITSVHNVIDSRTLPAERVSHYSKPCRTECAVHSHKHLCYSPVCTQNNSTAS